MDAFDLNGGNAGLTRGSSNLENVLISDATEQQCFEEDSKLDNQEFNGDFKPLSIKKVFPQLQKKKLRKLKANLNTIEGAQKLLISSSPKLNKRRISDLDDFSSDECEEFNGFDVKDPEIFASSNIVLKKLIAEAESTYNSRLKRRKLVMPLWKNVKNADCLIEETDDNTTDSEDQKMVIESDICNITADESSLKSEKSTNSTISINSNKSKRSRSRGASPGSAIRQKIPIDITNPVYKEPFNYGWKRELVYRAGASENQVRRMADIYYYTPEGKKVRSYREVIEFLTSSDLTIDNFTFFKEPLGVNDPDKEIIRDAKKARKSYTNLANL